MKKNNHTQIPFASITLIFFCFLTFLMVPPLHAAAPVQTIAIFPFDTISEKDMTYIQKGAQQMLHSRLRWVNHIQVVHPDEIRNLLHKMDDKDINYQINKIAAITESDYVLTGSITQFSDAFSIDAKIYDIKNKKYLSFFEQSKKIDDLIPKINTLSAKINKKVFKRQTMVYDNLVKKEKEKAEQWKRQNPENLMPSRPRDDSEKTPIWKFWEYL